MIETTPAKAFNGVHLVASPTCSKRRSASDNAPEWKGSVFFCSRLMMVRHSYYLVNRFAVYGELCPLYEVLDSARIPIQKETVMTRSRSNSS